MKSVLFTSLWIVVLAGIVLVAVALGLLAGPWAVLLFLGGVGVVGGILGLVALNSSPAEVSDVEVS